MSRGVQLGFTCEGMAPDTIDETNIEAVFALWADRIEDLNRAIADHTRTTGTVRAEG